MWKSGKSSRETIIFYPQPDLWINSISPQANFAEKMEKVLHKNSIHNPQPLWKLLQAGIDIGGDVPNVILQALIAASQRRFYFANRVNDGRVILVHFLTDFRGGKVG